jgi:PAS domain S-box-containing protein
MRRPDPPHAGSSIESLSPTDAVAAAMDEAPVCFGLVDRELHLLYANRAFTELLGGRPESLVDIEALAPEVVESLRLATGGDSIRDLEVAHAGRHYLINAFPMVAPGGATLGASLSMRDVSAWVADRERVRVLQDISERLAAAATPDEVSEIAAEAGVRVLGAAASAVALLAPPGRQARVAATRGFAPEILERWRTIDLDGDAPIAVAVREAKPLFMDSLDDLRARFPSLERPGDGRVAWAAVPLEAPTQVIGALALSFEDTSALAPSKRNAILTLAAQCAQALQRAMLTADLARGNQRLEAALEAGTMGWWEWDPAENRVVWSPSLERIYGLEPGTFGGLYDDYISLIHPDDRPLVADRIADGLTGQGHAFEHRIVRPDGSVRWVDGRGRVIDPGDGAPVRMGGITVDITERKRDELALRFLADASDLLAESLDSNLALRRLASLAVPALADWCSVYLVEGGTIRHVTVAHSDPEKVALVERLQVEYPPDPDAPIGVPAVIRTGRTELLQEIPDELLEEAAPDERLLRILRELELRSALTVPLIARDRTIGAITFVHAESGRLYEERDVRLAEDLAHRAALAIDNARLFEERSKIADTLQASLLPPSLPSIPGLDIAAGYQAGGEGVDVGGDVYDIFQTGDGRWVVMIADVCGKGAVAATLTGVTRHTARAAAMEDDDPRHVLETVNRALRRTETGDLRFCTAAVGVLETSDRTTLTMGRAGHPSPLLRRAGGVVERVGGRGTLLGVFDDPELDVETTTMERGDILILYTDGVTDAWRDTGGEDRLVELLAGLPDDATAEQVVDQIKQVALRPGGSNPDDVAILVLRLTGRTG